jgi:hypothetical protein
MIAPLRFNYGRTLVHPDDLIDITHVEPPGAAFRYVSAPIDDDIEDCPNLDFCATSLLSRWQAGPSAPRNAQPR